MFARVLRGILLTAGVYWVCAINSAPSAFIAPSVTSLITTARTDSTRTQQPPATVPLSVTVDKQPQQQIRQAAPAIPAVLAAVKQPQQQIREATPVVPAVLTAEAPVAQAVQAASPVSPATPPSVVPPQQILAAVPAVGAATVPSQPTAAVNADSAAVVASGAIATGATAGMATTQTAPQNQGNAAPPGTVTVSTLSSGVAVLSPTLSTPAAATLAKAVDASSRPPITAAAAMASPTAVAVEQPPGSVSPSTQLTSVASQPSNTGAQQAGVVVASQPQGVMPQAGAVAVVSQPSAATVPAQPNTVVAGAQPSAVTVSQSLRTAAAAAQPSTQAGSQQAAVVVSQPSNTVAAVPSSTAAVATPQNTAVVRTAQVAAVADAAMATSPNAAAAATAPAVPAPHAAETGTGALPLAAANNGGVVVANPALLPASTPQLAPAAALPPVLGTPNAAARSNGVAGVPPAAISGSSGTSNANPPEVAYSAFWITFSAYFPQAAHFIEGAYFSLLVKGMCMAGNVLVQVSPYSQVRRWETRGNTGEADAAPYVSIAFGGWQWCFYGLFAWLLTKRSGFLILVQSNVLGAVLGSYYTVTFYRNCRNGPFLDSLQRYLSAAVTLALLQVCAIFVLPAERSLFLTGCLSSFCGFVAAASMLVSVPLVIRTKDSSSIPAAFIIATLVSSLVWCLCGWLLDDPLVVGPNLFAVFASLVNMYLKWKYPSSIDDKDDKDGGDGASPLEAALRFARDAFSRGTGQTANVSQLPRRRPSKRLGRTLTEDTASDTNELTPLIASISYQATEQQADATFSTPPAAVTELPTPQTERPTAATISDRETTTTIPSVSSPTTRRAGTTFADGTGGTF